MHKKLFISEFGYDIYNSLSISFIDTELSLNLLEIFIPNFSLILPFKILFPKPILKNPFALYYNIIINFFKTIFTF